MRKMRGFGVLFLTIVLLFSSLLMEVSAEETVTYDMVIKGGDVYNPSTEHELKGYTIGIIDDKIEKITKEDLNGETEIDASGMVVSPGFIDLVSYDPNYVGIELKVLDGVTSNLAMHGGTEDAASWYANWESNGVLTNFGASSFITRQRWPIVGEAIDAELTDEQVQTLVEAVRENIEAGALGISFSLEYVPGVKHELEPLLELAKEYDVPTFYHLRYSDEERGLDGVQEVIDLGEKTGAAIHIMHINSTGGTFVMEEALAMVKEAKENGLDITTDFYPYDFWATYLGSARFEPGWQENFNLTYEDLQVAGTDTRVSADNFDYYRSQNSLVAALDSMPVSELEMLLADPDTMVGSDTIIEPHNNNHPRGAGAYSHLLGQYVREEQALSMMDAIKKVTYYPAKRMESSAPAMRHKGRIEIGADADITIFDPDEIIDKSTVQDPAAPSEGVEYVIINGGITKDPDGIVPNATPGKPIKSYFVEDISEDERLDYSIQLDDHGELELEAVYLINGKTYLPIEETVEKLGLSMEDSLDGTMKIGDFLHLEIGNKLATVQGDDIELIEEPMIYKEKTYIHEEDLKKVLETQYEMNELDQVLQIKSLVKSDSVETKETSKDAGDSKVMELSIVMVLLIALLFVLVKMMRKRNK